MTKRKRILVVQESMQPPGGGQAVRVWTIQALCREYDLDILTWVPVETDAINAFYGTQLDRADLNVIQLPAPLRAAIDIDSDPYSFQPMAVLVRYAKLIRSRYDLLIGLSNEIDFGVRGIQYIHYPYLEKKYRDIQAARSSWRASMRQLYEFYLRPWRLISGFTFAGMKKNVTLVNSDWTGKRVQALYNIPTQTLYPPIVGNFADVPWSARTNGFVCIGRLAREKEYERIFEILCGVRARGYPVQLYLVVSIPREHADRAYSAKIRALAQAHADWVYWHENISRAELERLISTQRYGIHAMPGEHFGMGIGEMMRGGCLVFVPNSGGQVEIVDRDEHLVYDTHAQAVEKITRLLDDPATQHALQARFAARAELYTETNFMQKMRAIVAAAL